MLLDLVAALRRLRHRPGRWLLIALSLTTGMAAVICTFTALNAVVLRPLPYAAPERLAFVWEDNTKRGVGLTPISVGNFRNFRASSSFEGLSAFMSATASLDLRGDSQKITAYRVEPTIWELLGAAPEIGRVFGDRAGENPSVKLAVLSHGLWTRAFGGRASIVGEAVTIDGEPYMVIGVMPPRFGFPPAFSTMLISTKVVVASADVWVPLDTRALPDRRDVRSLFAIGRLKPSVSPEQARRELALIAERLARDHPRDNAGLQTAVIGLSDQVLGNLDGTLIVAFSVALLVLGIAVANAIFVLLADVTDRLPELAVRSALGGSTLRILRPLVLANGVAAVVATIGAAAITSIVMKGFAQHGEPSIARLSESRVDAVVWLLMLAAVLVLVTVLTVVPLIRLRLDGLRAAITSESRSSYTRAVLVGSQAALAVIVLSAAGALLRSWTNLTAVSPGIDTSYVHVFETMLPPARYDSVRRRVEFQRNLLDAEERVSHRAAVVDFLPFTENTLIGNFTIEGADVVTDAELERPRAAVRAVSGSYFSVFAVPLITGRVFDSRDDAGSPRVAVVNDAFVARFSRGRALIGMRIKRGGPASTEPWALVVGVVGSTRGAGLQLEVQPEVFVPYQQAGNRTTMYLLVRTQQPPRQVVSDVRRQVQSIDAGVTPVSVRRMDDMVAASIGRPRLFSQVFSGLAVLAIVLGCIGLYGSQALAISQRSTEIGVRLSLGATAWTIANRFLMRTLRVIGAGIAVGAAAAIIVHREMETQFFGFSSPDWISIAASGLVVLLFGSVATALPIRRECRKSLVLLLKDTGLAHNSPR